MMLSSTDAALQQLSAEAVSIPQGSASATSHDLVQPVRQLLSSVASNNPASRSLAEELSQLESSDQNFHR